MPRFALPLACALALAPAALLAQTARQFAPLPKSALPGDPAATRAIALGDLDGDGDLDIALANDGRNRIYRNDGQARFTDVTDRWEDDEKDSRAIALGDVDGDGDLDIVVGSSASDEGRDRIYRNASDGSFTPAPIDDLPTDGKDTLALVLADLDGDGDLDLILARDGRNRYLENDGHGKFTDVSDERLSPDDMRTTSLVVGDIDGDGDLDLIAGNAPAGERRGQDVAYYNDGDGRLNDVGGPPLPVRSEATRALALGDVDGDGDLDLVVGGRDVPDRLLLNGGHGLFTDAPAGRFPDLALSTSGLAFGDVDGDGDLDLLVAVGSELPLRSGVNRLYLNSGAGAFTDATADRLPADDEATLCVLLGDLDGDRDPELLVGNVGSERLAINLLRQAVSVGDPWRGQAYQIDFHSKPGFETDWQYVFPFFGARLAATPFLHPIMGRFALDPTAMAALPMLELDRATGRTSLRLRVPIDPWLIDRPIYVQGVFFDTELPLAAPFRTSNVNADIIR